MHHDPAFRRLHGQVARPAVEPNRVQRLPQLHRRLLARQPSRLDLRLQPLGDPDPGLHNRVQLFHPVRVHSLAHDRCRHPDRCRHGQDRQSQQGDQLYP